MVVFVNSNNQIKAVGSTDNTSLREVMIDSYIFNGWSNVRICCQQLILDENGEYEGHFPYIKTSTIDQLDMLSKENQELAEENNMLKQCILELSTVVYN